MLRTSLTTYLSLALGVAILACIWLVRSQVADRTPLLTENSFQAAWERWRERGPQSYEVMVKVSGKQPAVYRVVVVQGEAKEAYRNEQALLQKRTYETWSVPGMFSTIEADLSRSTRSASGARLTLRAEFDSETGYPRRYRRIEWGQPTEVNWVVVQLTTP